MRTILFTGKGGVGKTTLSAATALRSASLGKRTLVISTDIAHSLADALDMPLGNDPLAVGPPGLYAAELDTAEELERYWGEIKRRIADSLRERGFSPTVAGELAVLPGLDEIVGLVRIKRYHDEGAYDVLIIDSAPTGAAMRLLSAPDLGQRYARSMLTLSSGLARMVMPSLRSLLKTPLGEGMVQERIARLFEQVRELREILTDGEQTSVRLVLNPDHMSLRETQRAYTYMNLFGLTVDAVYANRVIPIEVQDPFFEDWKLDQAAHLEEIRHTFAPLAVFEVPLMRQEVVGLEALGALAETLYGERDPTEPLATEQPLRFYMEDHRYMLALRIPGVSGGSVELSKQGDELYVRLGRLRRSLVLPQYLAGMQPTWARVEGNVLKVAFEDKPQSSG
ncbi:MAG: ArsA family ATPase [Chloroflexi bacterium]|nr:ArsA family ATPase [Chloroflexota bacterium]